MHLFIVVLALSVCGAYSATTTPAHVHHEKPENEGFSFHYEGTTHAMLVMTNNKCYIWTITPDEQSQVHTDSGLRTIELRVLNEISNALYTVVPEFILHPNIVKSCTLSHHQHSEAYYLVH